MSEALADLLDILALERVDDATWRGRNQGLGWGTIFGGQLLGQALSAAFETVEEAKEAHSLHAYFLETGDLARPVLYRVTRTREGRSFATRRVCASQDDREIFECSISFHRPEPGFEHQTAMPAAPSPESRPNERERLLSLGRRLSGSALAMATALRPFDLRYAHPANDPIRPEPMAPSRQVWLRAHGRVPDDPRLHQCLLAYATDQAFVPTALLPHGVTALTPGVRVASLDHAVWFHRPARADDWLLYEIDSPSAQRSRGLVTGRLFTRDGLLVASAAQEGMLRHEAASEAEPVQPCASRR